MERATQQVIASLTSFGEFAPEMTCAALRVLVQALNVDIMRAFKARDYQEAQRLAFDQLRALEELEKRKGSDD